MSPAMLSLKAECITIEVSQSTTVEFRQWLQKSQGLYNKVHIEMDEHKIP